MATATDYNAFQTDTASAMTDAIGKSATHFQSIAMDNVDFAKRSYEDAATAFSLMTKAPSLGRAAEIQREYLKSAYEGFFAHMNKVGEKQAAFAREFARTGNWPATA